MNEHRTRVVCGRPNRRGAAGPAVCRIALILICATMASACAGRGAGTVPDTPEAAGTAAETQPGPRPDPADIDEAVGEAVAMVGRELNEPVPEEGPVPGQGQDSPEDPCRAEAGGPDTLLDKTQRTVYWSVCGTARWFDGFFGDRQRFDATNEQTWGRLGIGAFYDERDRSDLDFKLRAQIPLPALRERTAVVLGRGTTEELIEDRGTAGTGDSLPDRFNNVEDPAWLLGVGYRRGRSLRRGFDFSVGAKLRAPPEPYVRGRWFRNWTLSDQSLLRFRETVFWTEDRRFGQTTQFDYDHLIGDSMLLRFANFGTIAEREIEGWELGSSLILFQGLSNRRALTYLLFVRGQTKAEEELRNLGFELRYRQRILRKWLFIEYRGSVTWPKEFADEKREANLGAGIGFEMYFGPVPDEQMR